VGGIQVYASQRSSGKVVHPEGFFHSQNIPIPCGSRFNVPGPDGDMSKPFKHDKSPWLEYYG
jgi:hypothetical protein